MRLAARTTLCFAATGVLTVAIATVSVVPALAAITWEGSGDPQDSGFTKVGVGTLIFDSDDGVPGSAPGFMFQDFTTEGTHHFALDQDLTSESGWIFETSVMAIEHTGNGSGWGIFASVADDVGVIIVKFFPDEIIVHNGMGHLQLEVPVSAGFHSVRMSKVPGPRSVDVEVFIDGISFGVVDGSNECSYLGWEADKTVRFGDIVVGSGRSTAVWDYVRVTFNQPPSAEIVLPETDLIVASGEPVAFSGVANDPEDGWLGDLEWSSDLDGIIGVGESFSSDSLSKGVHSITLTATDSEGATGTAEVSVGVSEDLAVALATVAQLEGDLMQCEEDLDQCLNPPSNCSDGLDNDGDGFCDTRTSICSDGSVPGDPGCRFPADPSEHCGLGFELAFLLPLLMRIHGRRKCTGA